MPLEIKVQGQAAAGRMADEVEIHTAFKSKGFYRHEASATLFKAVEQLTDTLQTLSPTLETQKSMLQATHDGPTTSWSVGTQKVQTQSLRIPKTKAFQDIHMVTVSLVITIRDFQILGQVSKAITRTACIASVETIWSLTDLASVRLKTEVHELAAKDALNKATAVASSIGFQTITAEEVVSQSPDQALCRANNLYSDGYPAGPSRFTPHRRGCLPDDSYTYGGADVEFSDSKWTSRDETGDLDAWTLVLVPKKITLTATVDTKFSATSSTGFVYEEINQHRFITRS
jgi:hypothetical protein